MKSRLFSAIGGTRSSDQTRSKEIFCEALESRALLSSSFKLLQISTPVLPDDLVSVRGQLFFSGFEQETGRELYVYDGKTQAHLVRELVTGPAIADEDDGPGALVPFGKNVVFTGPAGAGGPRGLWISDGTARRTRLLASGNSFFPTQILGAIGNLLMFEDDGRLWRTDGTTEGTFAISSAHPSGTAAAFGKFLFFSARDGLWRTDGTAKRTAIVADLGQAPREMTATQARLIFSAGDSRRGQELWSSDGTAVGTGRLIDIDPGPESSLPDTFINDGSRAFFIADDGQHGRELWTSDGTGRGTHLVSDIRRGGASSNISVAQVIDGSVFFSADDGKLGSEVWMAGSDGAVARRLTDIAPGTLASDPFGFTFFANRVFFTAVTNNQRHLYSVSVSGTDVQAVPKASMSIYPVSISAGATTLFFAAVHGSEAEIWALIF